MLETLLESGSKRERSSTGAIVSVMTHTVLIGGALYATAQARVEPSAPPQAVHAVYFPDVQISPPRRARPRQPHSPTTRRLTFNPPDVDIKIPPVEIGEIVSSPSDLRPGPIAAPTPTTGGEKGVPDNSPFRADQVEKQASVAAGSSLPRYPEMLRNAGVEGQVVAEFVVDEEGRAEDGTVRFPGSDNQFFEDAVRVALRRMRFLPAEVGGRKVKQMVQMPFVFRLDR